MPKRKTSQEICHGRIFMEHHLQSKRRESEARGTSRYHAPMTTTIAQPAAANVYSSTGLEVKANQLDFVYDTFSINEEANGEPLLLIMGIGAQRIFWPDGFCNALARRNFHVVRFDNRDVGESSKMDALNTPSVIETMAALASGKPVPAPYTLDHMADDTAAIIEALGFGTAHVCGASMGGMIAQTVAIRHPSKIRSLVSIMSSTGNPELPPADPATMSVLVTPAPFEPAAYAEHAVKTWRTIGSPGFPFDEEGVRARVRLAFERGISPKGFSRQLAAILGHGNRKPALSNVTTPTMVIHGDADKLVPPTGGIDTAEAISHAELMMIEGMGHDLPKGAWDRMADGVRKTADRAKGIYG